jgi:hypothetical protein
MYIIALVVLVIALDSFSIHNKRTDIDKAISEELKIIK